jgi:hypothetical protein
MMTHGIHAIFASRAPPQICQPIIMWNAIIVAALKTILANANERIKNQSVN